MTGVTFSNLGHSAADRDDTEIHVSAFRTLRVVLILAFRAAPRLMLAVVSLEPISRICGVLVAASVGLLADAALDRTSTAVTTAAIVLAATVGASLALGTAGLSLRRYVSERIGHEVDVQLSQLVSGITGIEHLERSVFLDRIELLRADPQGLGNVVNSAVVWITSLATAFATVTILARIHPALGLLPMTGILGVWSNRRFQRRWEHFEEVDAPRARRRLHLFRMSTSPAVGKEVRAFGLRDEIRRRHGALWSEHEVECFRVNLIDAIEWTIFGVVQAGAWVGAVGVATWSARRGGISPGEAVTVIMLGGRLNSVITGVVDEAGNLARMLRGAKRFVWLSDYANTVAQLGRRVQPAPTTMSEGIAFDRVSFTYPGAASPSLQDVNLHLHAGSIVAIVGDNGAGKTTFIKQLCRFYDPTAGAVSVDGVDLRDIDPEHWRSALTATFQDHLRLELRARESIGLGDLGRNADDDAVARAVSRAGADDVIASLPEGLDTQLGNRWRGTELSGGQWQKLSLSRGMMRNAPLVTILDEPTSALDALTEQELFDRFAAAAHERRERGAITILVSHRFSTVRNADLIVVFADGTVVETGTHEDLMTAGGRYAELFTLQARSYQ